MNFWHNIRLHLSIKGSARAPEETGVHARCWLSWLNLKWIIALYLLQRAGRTAWLTFMYQISYYSWNRRKITHKVVSNSHQTAYHLYGSPFYRFCGFSIPGTLSHMFGLVTEHNFSGKNTSIICRYHKQTHFINNAYYFLLFPELNMYRKNIFTLSVLQFNG